MRGVSRIYLDVNTLEQMVVYVARYADALHQLVKDGALAHSVYAAKDVHLAVEVPLHMAAPAP